MAAQDISGLTSIRSDLNAKGITNDRIGYNNKTGMVTIDGQDFLHPTTAVGGTSYADPTAYNNAYNIFNAGQQQQQAAQKASTAEQNYLQALNTPAVNPYDQQVSDTLAQLMQRLNNPAPYDVYSSPEYAAQQAQAQKSAQQSVRQAQESLGASGLGRSSVLSDRAQGIQNDANAYLQTQVVPLLQQQHQAQEQQQLANLSSLLSALSGQQSVYDTRQQNQQSALGQLLDYTTGRADAAQQQVTQAQQQAYQTARDAIADKQYQQQFDENVRQFGLTQALQQAQLDHQISNDNAQLAVSRMNAQTSAASAANAARNAAADNQLARERFEFEKQQASQPQPEPQAAPKTAEDYYKELDSSMYLSPEQITSGPLGTPVNTGRTIVNDPDGLEAYIYSLGLDDNETYKLLRRYGLIKQ